MSGRKENRMFVGEGGTRALHWQRGPDRTVEVYKLEEPSQSVGRYATSRRSRDTA